MKPVMPTSEASFILAALAERRRIDDRGMLDYRPISIEFGRDRGCCYVRIGETQVMAQVSCMVSTPKDARPTEGIVSSSVQLSPMAAPQFEAGRSASVEAVEAGRLLERCLRESRCVDTESLCISSGNKVWSVRVDVRVLAHRGNIVDAASVASIAGLLHFRLPDVSVVGDDITVHTADDRDPVPLSVHHVPICVTTAYFAGGKYQVVDPTDREEMVMDGRMVVAMNKHRELCMLQVMGRMLMTREQVTRCTNMAVSRVAMITDLIHDALERDRELRLKCDESTIRLNIGGPLMKSHLQTCIMIDDSDTVDILKEAAARFDVPAAVTVSKSIIECLDDDNDLAGDNGSDLSSNNAEENGSEKMDVGRNFEGQGTVIDIAGSDDDVMDVSDDIKTESPKKNLRSSVVGRAKVKPDKVSHPSPTGGKNSKGVGDGKGMAKGKGKKSGGVIELSGDSDEEKDVVIVKAKDLGFKKKKKIKS